VDAHLLAPRCCWCEVECFWGGKGGGGGVAVGDGDGHGELGFCQKSYVERRRRWYEGDTVIGR